MNNYDFKFISIPFKDVLSIEIVEDGVSITRSSRRSQLGGALRGGVLAGGVGAIIGGTTGTKTTTETVKTIDILITVNEIQNPIYMINFYSEMNATLQVTNPKDAMLVNKKRRYFDESGKAKQDIDYFHSGEDLHNSPNVQ
ncbi:hypothetical protein [Lysinibacillus fusiformis]|uniref:hypothetical protein n=1 Tax=Lysinibacillus fusiformis TaxID=28031 RepID=UPI003828191A